MSDAIAAYQNRYVRGIVMSNPMPDYPIVERLTAIDEQSQKPPPP